MNLSSHIRTKETKNGRAYQIVIELPPDPRTGERQRKYKTVKNVTKKQAEKLMRQMVADMENGEYIEQDTMTLGEWMDRWFNLFKKDIEATTKRGYRKQIDLYILTQPIANKPLQAVTSEDIQEWINTISAASPATGEAISPKTVRNVYMNMQAAMKKAVSLKKIRHNPCEEVTIPKCKKYQGEVYDEKDIEKLLNCIKGTDLEVPIELALILGLRRGELLALKWDHIDFEKLTISIDENMVYVGKSVSDEGYIIKAPKSASGIREIIISEKLAELLKKYREAYLKNKEKYGKSFNDEGYVVCQPNGNPYKPSSMTRKFIRFLDSHNLKKIRLHDLRHTNATLMLRSGVSAKEAQARLGHADVSVTLGTYSHVLNSMQRETANKIESAILG